MKDAACPISTKNGGGGGALRWAPRSLRSGPQATCSTSGAARCHPLPERGRGNACVRRTRCRAEATAAQRARSAEYTNGSELCWWLGGPRERRASRPGPGVTDCASIFCAIWLPPPPLCAHVTCRPATGSGGSGCRCPKPSTPPACSVAEHWHGAHLWSTLEHMRSVCSGAGHCVGRARCTWRCVDAKPGATQSARTLDPIALSFLSSTTVMTLLASFVWW